MKHALRAGLPPIPKPAWRWWLALALRAFGAWCIVTALLNVHAVAGLVWRMRSSDALQLVLAASAVGEVLLTAISGAFFLITPPWGFPGFYAATLISILVPQPHLPLEWPLLAGLPSHPLGARVHVLAVDICAIVLFAVVQNILRDQVPRPHGRKARRWPLGWPTCNPRRALRWTTVALRLFGIWTLAAALIGLWQGGVPPGVPGNLPPGSASYMAEVQFIRCISAAFSGAFFIASPRWGFPAFYVAAVLSVPLGIFALPFSQLGTIHASYWMTAALISMDVNAAIVLVLGLVQCLLLRRGGTIEAESRHPAGTTPAIGGTA